MSLPPSAPFAGVRFAVVDLETTGASAIYDRVTEVAVVLVQDGQVLDTFQSLVDPGAPIPPFITRMTGITNAMVQGKPSLRSLIPRLEPLFDGAVFVAHNVGFDYAFLRHAWTRDGRQLELPRLCTVRLSRRLASALRSHKLDTMLAHYAIACEARHRALGDARATALLLQRLLGEAQTLGLTRLEDLLALQQRPAARTQRTVDEAVVGSLPIGPGVYVLKDADGHVLYIGKSQSVKRRVREHLRGDAPGQPRLRRALGRVRDVEAYETGSELEALFLESRLIKRYLPEANAQQRTRHDYPFLRLVRDAFPRLEATREPPNGRDLYFGPFRRAAVVAEVAEQVSQALGLRSCSEPIAPGHGPCLLLDLGKCSGPCVGAVDAAGYAARAERAVALLEGRDRSLLDVLARQRDALAEDLRFEEAAELRDRIQHLEYLLGAQRSLQAVGERNLVVVAPALAIGGREVLFIRSGRLARQLTERGAPDRRRYARVLGEVYAGAAPGRPVTHEEVDEMHLLDEWLKRKRATLRPVPVDPADPQAALPELLAAARAAFRRPQPAASTPRPRVPSLPLPPPSPGEQREWAQ